MSIIPNRTRATRTIHWSGLAAMFLVPGSMDSNVQGQALPTAVFEGREAVRPALSNHVIQTTVRRYLPQLRECFERLDKPLRSASISLDFIVERDGRTLAGETVDTSNAATSSEAFAELAQCVDEVRRTMQFPAPEDGIVHVSYPILFEDPSAEK